MGGKAAIAANAGLLTVGTLRRRPRRQPPQRRPGAKHAQCAPSSGLLCSIPRRRSGGHMNDARSLTDNLELIIDCCRYSGGLLSEAAVKKKYRFTDDVWTRLGEMSPSSRPSKRKNLEGCATAARNENWRKNTSRARPTF